MSSMSNFTWIPFYEEMAQKLLTFKDRRKDLVDIVYSLGNEYTDYIYDEQLDENGKAKTDANGKKLRQHVEDIDPFSVMAIFNRKILDENRNIIVQKFKGLLKIDADVPEDYDSIPILMNLQSTLYWRETASAEIPILWNLFEAAAKESDDIGASFDEIVKFKGIKWNITIALYWCFPRKFMPLDGVSRDFLKEKCGISLENQKITYGDYLNIANTVRSKFEDPNFGIKNYSEFSMAAYKNAMDKQNVWIVGASWEGSSYIENFYKEGYWEGGPGKSKSQLSCLQEVKKGDLIALKTRKGAYIENQVPDLEICYVGIATEDSKATGSDNKWFSFKVQWFKDYPRTVYPQMYKKPYNGTIGKCDDKKILKDLITFAEEGVLIMSETEQKIQDYATILESKRNIILQGAPGTGKTYTTASLALSIIGKLPPREAETDKEYHKKVMEEYEKQQKEGQIAFSTFHQSMDYEDFVEGIKPKFEGSNCQEIQYEIKDGIFKEICQNAQQITTQIQSNPIDFTTTRIFKMSLGEKGRNDIEVFDYCIENNVVALGWGDNIDFSDCQTRADFKAKDSSWGSFAMEIFKLWMRIGDIILISDGTKAIKAIARITGNYEFHDDSPINYCQFRKVEWLYNGENISIDKIYTKNLSQQTIYAFYFSKQYGKRDYNASINTDFLNNIITGQINNEKPKNYVLIIDEINRGNVSKIFGELISLLEADKRAGGDHPLTVTLPYSKEQFSVPSNLYIIGTMNTTDRSVGSIDYAVRRRFAFVTLKAEKSAIESYYMDNAELEEIAVAKFDDVEKFLKDPNVVAPDVDFDDLMVGHSYFMAKTLEELKLKWEYEVIPLLKEYKKDGLLRRSAPIAEIENFDSHFPKETVSTSSAKDDE